MTRYHDDRAGRRDNITAIVADIDVGDDRG
jgi:hypothetical protein